LEAGAEDIHMATTGAGVHKCVQYVKRRALQALFAQVSDAQLQMLVVVF
jgi:hypothetical protein